MDNDWYESETAWWAKHGHAKDHLERLRDVCAEYQSTNPLEVRAESTDVSGQTAYRLRQTAPIPVTISLIVGDLMHCLRSSLDSLVFGIVRHSLGRDMTEDEEKACQFPICSSPDDFNKFLTNPRVAKIMDDRVRFALHGVQPFYWLEQTKMLHTDGADLLSYEEGSQFHPLMSVARLSNIDKHRRLTVAAWWPSLIYWTTGEEDDGEHQWRPVGVPPWGDGEIIGIMTGTGPAPKVVHQFNLVITDATSHMAGRWAIRDLADQAADWLSGVEGALRQMIRDFTQPPDHPKSDQPPTTRRGRRRGTFSREQAPNDGRPKRAAMTEPVPRPIRHAPSTVAEDRADGSLAFLAVCTCSWRGPDRDDEIPADCDRWGHVDGCDQEPDGSWIRRL